MSIIKVEPPQTYSRLFRPWDVKSAKESPCVDTSALLKVSAKCSPSLRLPVDQIVPDKSMSPDYYPVDYVAANLSCYGYENGYGPFLGVPSTPDFCYPSAIAPVPLLGMDPAAGGITKAMEQEYLRVLAEDAQTKAANARKQRPKKFKCTHCDVAFSNNGQLKGHVRIHTGERPFKCDLESCGKTFTRNEELTRHKRIHTGLRPFACSVCGKKFGRRDHLKKHMKTHMPQERPLSSAIFLPMYPYLYGY